VSHLSDFGNHREGKLKSSYRVFLIRFMCIMYLKGLQYFIVFVLVYILRYVGVARAYFLLLLLKVLVVRGLNKNEVLRSRNLMLGI
jgi:hypothetical protein